MCINAKYKYTHLYPMRTYPSKLTNVDSLTSKILDDNYTEEELTRLSLILKGSKEARTRYAELTVQDSLLHWESVEYAESPDLESKDLTIIGFPAILSVAAAVVALFGVWWFHTATYITSSEELTKFVKIDLQPTANLQTSSSENLLSDKLDSKKNFKALNLPYNSDLGRSKDARNKAIYGIEILRKNKSFGEGGVVEFNDDFASWKRTDHLSVPAENGILPMLGEEMIKFSSMSVDVHAQNAESSETLQVVDVRKINSQNMNVTAHLQTSLFFNKGIGLSGDSTEFALSFHAIASDENNENTSIGHQAFFLDSDVNPSTWEELKQDFVLPIGTEFVIVSMSAKNEGPNAFLPDTGGHYADGLSINLFIDGQDTVGPL